METYSETVKEFASKAVLAGAIGYGAGYLYGLHDTHSVLGMNMPGTVALGVSPAVGSLGADVSAHYVLPHIPAVRRVTNLSSGVIGAIVAGGLAAWLMAGNLKLVFSQLV